MTNKNPDFINMVSPKGEARYAWITNPKTQFKQDGEYTLDVVFPLDEVEDFIATLDELNDKFFEKAKEGVKPTIAKGFVKGHPYKMEEDEEGNETGNVIITFKTDAIITSKKTGKTWSGKPNLFDAFGRKIEYDIKVGNGSVVKVAFLARPKGKNPLNAYGVKLVLKAVQIIELIEWDDGNAGSYGFSEEEGGFSAPQSHTQHAEGDGDVDF